MDLKGKKASAGSRLKTESGAKAAAGKKLKNEKASQAAAGEKLRFDGPRLPDGPAGEKEKAGVSHGRRTPGGSHVSALISNAVHRRIEEDSDGNAGVEALDRGARAAEDVSNTASRMHQKHAIRKEYAAAKAGKSAGAASGGAAAGNAGKAAKEGRKASERILGFVSKHRHGLLTVSGLLLLVLMISGTAGSCSVMFQGGTDVVVETSYTAEDIDILGAEADYRAMEFALQARINGIRDAYPGYDGYDVSQDQVGHNPYELASLLTVMFENYTRSQVQDTLEQIFAAQYELTLEEAVEIRYRTETRTETVTFTDPETGGQYEEEVEYPESVPYEYRVLHVSLENNGVSYILHTAGLTEDRMSRYGLLMQTLGNRPDIFGNDPYAVAAQEVLHYDIPDEALTDERFRNMITEAEKYLGYPYVWGGSTPSTSFDCSGFVSWVVNHCGNGWSVGRLTAEGLRQICAIIPRSEARPGDLIFFQGTYDTPGASHVGIYVGDGMMIHAGNPIQYASTETPYRQAHFYCFGRLP